MQKNTIQALAKFLNSPLLLEKCLDFLIRKDEPKYEKIWDYLNRDLFFSLPTYTLHQFEGLKSFIYTHSENDFILWRLLHFLAQRFFIWSPNMGLPVIRWERVLEFQWILGEIFIDPIWLFSITFETDSTELYFREEIPPDNWEEFLLPPVDEPVLLELKKKGLSEVHRHFNGSALPLALWEDFIKRPLLFFQELFHPNKKKKLESLLPPEVSYEKFKFWIYLAPIIRKVLQSRLGIKDFLNYLCIAETQDNSTSLILQYLSSEDNINVEEQNSFIGKEERNFILGCYHFYWKNRKSYIEHQLLLYIYFLIQNILLKFLVQSRDKKGFERFSEFSQSLVRDITERNCFNRFLQAQIAGGVKILEFRIAPKDKYREFRTRLDNPKRVLEHDAEGKNFLFFKEETGNFDGLNINAGCIVHFIKEKDDWINNDLSFCPPRHYHLRKKLWRQAEILLKLKKTDRFAKFICGLDAANNEIFARPEVFAPVIRFLRQKIFKSSFLERNRYSSFHLTFHAGENFRHILSGLRYIDETILFLEMRPGDRLGHALALGIDPYLWMKRTGAVCYLPQGEWIDNLVWFKYCLNHLSGFESVIFHVEEEIEKRITKVYGDGATPDRLYLMWKYLRKEDPLFVDSPDIFLPARWLDDARRKVEKQVYELWKRYHFDVVCRREYDRIIEVSIEKDWIPAIKAAQDKLLNKIIGHRLVIEVNPTSNLAIGLFYSLSEHPIFTWFPPVRDTQTKYPWVVIGSDDPGIFHTELWHEYVFLARAAEEQDYSPQVIADWLEYLARLGFRFSFID